MLFILLSVALTPALVAQIPASLDLDVIRAIPAQHDGRWPPLDTVARDTVESVTGTPSYAGHDPVLLLLAWTFNPQHWQGQRLIRIGNAELRSELQLPATQTAFSYAELVRHAPLRKLANDVRQAGGRKLNPLEAKVSQIEEKLIRLQRVFAGATMRVIPHPTDPKGAWGTIPPSGRGDSSAAAATAAWGELRTAFLADDAPAFAAATDRLRSALGSMKSAQQVDPKLIATELRYNALRPFRSAWIVMAVGAVLAAGATIVRRKWFDALAVIALVVGFGTLTYGLALRWQIAGRIPAANMFESLLFVSWGAGAFAIVAMIVQRQRLVPLTASAMGALALALADCLPLDSYVRPIAPVLLDTVWMSIHVPVIMVSYSVLALAVLIAHAQVITMAVAPARKALAAMIDQVHYWYVHVGSILLLAGIVTGSMWAASSWGRYWGWDPKEVWSLVAFLGYMAILHVRIDKERIAPWMYVAAGLLTIGVFALIIPRLGELNAVKVLSLVGVVAVMLVFVLARGMFATALKSILAFWLIIMTYVGVNFVLGIGLHSYGFGTGAVVRYMFLLASIDLALVALCCVVYLARGAARIEDERSQRALAYG